MSSISIRDSVGVEILSASPHVTSGFGRYLQGVPAQLLAGADVASQLKQALHLVNPGPSGLGLSFSHDVPLGRTGASLMVAAGTRSTLQVYNRAGMLLFEDTFIGEPVRVEGGRAFVAFTLTPALDIGLQRETGNLSFGFEAGTEVDLRCYRPFEILDGTATLAQASQTLIEQFVVPNSVDDLLSMRDLPAGTIASVAGHGRLRIGASVNLAAAINPLASVDTIARLGTLSVGGAAAVTVGVQATVSGGFQVRVQKMDGPRVRLGYHTVATRGLDVSLEAAAGPGVSLGDRDLLGLLFGGETGLSGASEEELTAAGISREQLDEIGSAMRAGMTRRINLELEAQFSALRQHEAAFQYEIDLDALDATGTRALDEALAGDLTGLTRLEPALPAHGIAVLQSRTEQLRKRRVQWRLNLIGLVNVVSLTELVRTGTVFHDHESGALVVADEVSSRRLGGTTRSRDLRRLLYESMMLTVTYKAAGLDLNTTLAATQSFFHFDRSANRQRMADYLDGLAAVGLLPAGDIDGLLGEVDDFGRASLLIETAFDQAACDRLFAGQAPHTEGFYEDVGRLALLALVKDRDPDAYRRVPLGDGPLWARMKHAGQPSFRFVLPPPITGGASEALRVAVVAADYSLIRWWARAMATAAAALADMQRFLAGRDAATLDADDPAFRAKRAEVARALARAVQTNTSSFDDPWGLVALFIASGRTATATGVVASPGLTLFLPD